MELTSKDVKNIIEIIDEAQHLDEIDIVFGGFRLHVHRGAGESVQRAITMPAPASEPAPSRVPATIAREPKQSAASPAALADNEVAVRAPMIGTFYRAASPGAKPFVEVGQSVKASDDVAVIEVMKLFKTIHAGVDGRVVRIEAENAALVEFNQVLIVIARA